MVILEFGSQNPYHVKINRNWHDQVEKIITLGIFFLVFLCLFIVSSINQNITRNYFLLLILIIMIPMLSFFLFSISIEMDLEMDMWILSKTFMKIPFKKTQGKLSEIAFIVTQDITHEESDSKAKLTLNRTKYWSSFEFWGYSDASLEYSKDPEKWVLYSQTTFNYRDHNKQMEENVRIAKILEEFFQGLEIPLQYLPKREVKSKGTLISEN
ncbi:MAG: hypothetical protein E4G98_03915 [Promethearchaeota archaeon]|nr:MAG: hypothetical protein E4G98_03915 [Candidatus Lokiarchaeota archaeon]